METKESCLLGPIRNFKANNELIYISDGTKLICYQLDKNYSKGNIKYYLNKQGRGPGEYSEILDFSFNNDYFAVFCGNKVNLYDHNGAFVKAVSLDFAATEMILFKNYIVFFSLSIQNAKNSAYEIYVIDIKKYSTKRFLKYKHNGIGKFDDGYQLSVYNGSLYYVAPHRNVIYKFDDNMQPRPYAVIEFKNSQKRIYEISYSNQEEYKKILMSGNIPFQFNHFTVLNEKIGISFRFKQGMKCFWSDSINGSYSGRGLYTNDVFINDSICISPFESFQVARFNPEDYKDKKTREELIKIYSRVCDIKESDNPCLFIKKIKK